MTPIQKWHLLQTTLMRLQSGLQAKGKSLMLLDAAPLVVGSADRNWIRQQGVSVCTGNGFRFLETDPDFWKRFLIFAVPRSQIFFNIILGIL